MMENTYQTNTEALQAPETRRKTGWFAAGGIIGAIGASACCLLPLVLTIFGVSGAWMANLRAMEAYKPYFLTLAVVAIGYGFYQVYWKARQPCAEGSACAKPIVPGYLVKIALWTGAIILTAVITFNWWFTLVEPYLP